MNAHTSRRLVRAMIAAAGLAGAATAPGQVVNWSAGNGLWSNPASWNPVGIPNSASALVVIGAGGAYTVGIDMSPVVGRLTLSNPSGAAAIYNGRTLAIQGAGGIINDSTVTVNPTAEGSGTGVRFDVDAPLTGTGTLVLNANPGNIGTAVLYNSAGAVITQDAGHTIRGTGRVLAPLNNAGLIAADRSGLVLELAANAKTNSGVLRATGGGVLAINNSITQSALGTIEADGGLISIGNYTIANGLIDAKNLGLVRAYNSTFDSVAASGPIHIPNGYVLAITGTGLSHGGALTVNPTGEGSGTALRYDSPGILAGSGEVVLNANPGNADTAYITSSGGSLITLAAAHTIRGTGRIYAPLTNNGTIVADQNGLPLQFLGTGKTNNAMIRGTGGSYLDLLSIALTQSGAGRIVADGATTRIFGATVSGGLLSATAGGLTQVYGGTLSDVTTDGPAQVRNGYTLAVTGAALTNNGTITINPTGEGSGTALRYDSTALLTGSGAVVLNANPANLDTAYVNTAGTVCTVDANQTIRGTGRIYANLVNNGVIAADLQGRTLELLGSGKTNNALISATGGSALWINSALQQGASGLVRVEDATLGIGAYTITGGQINATGTGLVRTYNTTLDAVRATGPLDVPNGYSLYVAGGGLTHDGTITINPTEEGSGTQIRFDANVPLAGTGEVVLKANAGNLDTAIVQTSGANVFTLPATQTIRGTGSVYGAMINNGLVSADRAGRTLQLIGAPKTNNATLKAAGGGVLVINAAVANASGQIAADAGSVSIGTVGIGGGQIHALNGGLVTVANSTFTDVTSDAPLRIPNGYSLYIRGAGLTNNGIVTINPSAEGSGTALRFDVTGVLGGSGQVVLNANPGNVDTAILHPTSGNTITIGPAQSVCGRGRMYGSFALQGKIAPGVAGGPAAALQVDTGSITMGPTASLDLDIMGGAAGQWDRLVGNDAIALDGTLNVSLAYTPSGAEQFDIITGSSITGRFSVVNITGAASPGFSVVYTPTVVRLMACLANCDLSTTPPILNVLDFTCFLNRFAAADPYANCDGSTTPPVLNVNDFICFLNRFAAGCQ